MLQAIEFESTEYGNRFWVVVEESEVDETIASWRDLGYGLSDIDNVVYGPFKPIELTWVDPEACETPGCTLFSNHYQRCTPERV